ncbi:hypothetical protein TWF730_002071 [Orbilia blumenaviensis]|uniref:DUF7029 domain-containing protein n=1 Tax=Orbilia blumenaviensis TaxID=1796055 RepID=A0AAV9UHW6_9PEZI
MIISKLLPVALSFGLFGSQALAGVYKYGGEQSHSVHARSKVAAVPVAKSSEDPQNLLPIRAEHLFPQLHKRSEDLSNLHLEDAATLYFGKPAGGYNIHLATINAKPGEQHPLIALEKFDGLTKKIACKGEDIFLEFNDKNAMNYAAKQWNWVNGNNDDYFFLVSQHHHNGCNPEDERTPHKVVSVKSDARKLTLTLTVEPASWDEALGDFTFNFETIQHPIVKLAKRRDPWEVGFAPSPFSIIMADFMCSRAIAAGIDMPGCKENGDFSIEESLSGPAKAALEGAWNLIPNFNAESSSVIDWGTDEPDRRVEFTEATGVFPVIDGIAAAVEVRGTCIGCFIKGSLEYSASGGRDSKTGKTELVVAFQPKIKARLQLEIQGKVSVSKELNYLADFVSKGLKAYIIKDIICLEPQFLSGPGVIMKAGLEGNFTVGFTLDTGAPTIMLKAKSGEDVRIHRRGWKKIKVEPILKANKLKTRSEVNPYFRLGVGVGATFFKNSTISGRLGVWAGFNPQLITSLDLGLDSSGLCSNKKEIGAKFETKFRFDYSYTTVARLESESKLANFLFELVKPQSWADTRAIFNQDKKKVLFEKEHSVCTALAV